VRANDGRKTREPQRRPAFRPFTPAGAHCVAAALEAVAFVP
jgi:hypothetical protein